MKRNPTEQERESQKRIIFLIDTYCNGSQQEFADKCKIGKSSVSQYVNGTNFPSNMRSKQIADTFNVDPLWVMGFNVPMNSRSDPDDGDGYYLNPSTAKIAQDIKDSKDLRLLFDAARDASPEDLKTVYDVLLALKKKEGGSDDS